MGGKGSQTTNTAQTQTYTPDPNAYAGILGAMQQAQSVAQTPFQTPVAPVAGFSNQQQQAFDITGQSQGMAQPYFNQAAQYFSPQGTQQFLNPFSSNVMASMQDVFGQQMSQTTGQLTQQAGGVGADRIAVGQAQLANQQGLAAGQTMGNLYGQAAQQAQTAAYGTANLGSAAQNAQLQGAQALLGTGGLQQQLQQAQLNAPYQNTLQQIAWPYQNAQFLGGLTAALAPGLGGTTSGTGSTTFPPQNPLGTILGGLTAGAGLIGKFAKRGGRINPYPRLVVDNTMARGGSAHPYAFADGGDTDSAGGGDDDVGISYHDVPVDQNDEQVASAEKGQLAQSASSGDVGAQMAAMRLPSGLGTAPVNITPKSEVPDVKVNPIPTHMPNLDLKPPAPQSSGGGKGSSPLGGLTSLIGLAALARGGHVPRGRRDYRDPFHYDDGGGVDIGGGKGSDIGGGGGTDGASADDPGSGVGGDDFIDPSSGMGLGSSQAEIMQNIERLESPIKVEPPGNDTAAAGNLADNSTIPQAAHQSSLFGRNPNAVQPLGTEMPTPPAAAQPAAAQAPTQDFFDSTMMRQIKERQGLMQGLNGTPPEQLAPGALQQSGLQQLQQPKAVPTVPANAQTLADLNQPIAGGTPFQTNTSFARPTPQFPTDANANPFAGPTQAAMNTQPAAAPATQAAMNPPPSSGGAPMAKNSQDVARTVAQKWRDAGMSEKGIAGVMRNVQDESGFNPTLRHPDQPKFGGEAHYAHGLYQEGGTEWNNYQSWLNANHPGANWQDPALQSEFAANNLKNNYPGVWKQMNDAGSNGDAATAYLKGYLKPAAQYQASRSANYAGGIPDVDHYTGGDGSGATQVADVTQDQGPGHALGYAGKDDGSTGGTRSAGASTDGSGATPGDPGAGAKAGRKHTFGSSPWDHLIMAGLGIMGAAGQRDAHGLPLSPLAAVGQGALAGLKTSTSVEEAAQKLDQAAEFHNDQYNKTTLAQQQAHAIALAREARESRKEERESLVPKPRFGPYGEPLGNFVWSEKEHNWVPDTTQPVQPAQPTPQPAAITGAVTDNSKLVAAGPYDYAHDAPNIQKGMDVPDPKPFVGKSTQAIKDDAERFLLTGWLPPSGGPKNVQAQYYRTAVQNYAGALAQSRGLTGADVALMQRASPLYGKFLLGPDGRATVSLGTAVRHLDTVKELALAWKANDMPAVNRIATVLSQEFGGVNATNLNTAGGIVGPEIIKAIGIAGGGTAEERAHAQAQFSSARAPDQLLGAVDVTQRLLSGQLDGKRRQATAAGLTEQQFRGLIGERPYEILSGAERGAAPAAAPGASAAPAPAAMPTPPQGKPDAPTRFKQLKAGGMSDDLAYKQMHVEGYK